jgi:energy-coupling factor transport system ATP-binding protein
MVAHSMDDAANFSDKVIVMDHGQLLMEDRPEVVFSQGDTLNALGLGIPEPMRFLKKVSTRLDENWNDPLFSVEKAAEKISQYYLGKRGGVKQ